MPLVKSQENRNPGNSSVYPLAPTGTEVLLRVSGTELTFVDRCLVTGSSLFVVGAFAWAPFLYLYAWRKWKAIPAHQKRRKALYLALLLLTVAFVSYGPHRSPRFGRWLKVRKWALWTAWLKFIAMEVRKDQSANCRTDDPDKPAILAFVPHGIFPFAFAFGILPDMAQKAFGTCRPVVATATNFLPVVSDFLLWVDKIDASRSSVNKALANGDRIGIVPGGIAEIFEGYPKRGTNPNEEYSIVRKGFLQLAQQHGVPVIPIYCFGSTKMFHRWNVPLLDRLSSWIRASIVIFYGVWGLPIPFRQKLLYVIGNPIHPDAPANSGASSTSEIVNRMHQQFCDELRRIFNRHKESYGWEHKSLHLLSR